MTDTNSSILPALKEQRAKQYGTLDSNSVAAVGSNEAGIGDQTKPKGAKYYMLSNTRSKESSMAGKKA